MNAYKTCWCGNDQLKKFSPEYLECSKCGTLVSSEGLGTEDIQVKNDDIDFYGKEYWFSHQTEHYGFPDIYQRARQDLVERCIYWLQTLLEYKLPPAAVLELGCSHGGSVALLHWAGFKTSGLEMSPWVVEFAHKTFNIPMLLGSIEDQQVEAESLDAIVLYDVLEHLPDPLGTLGYCASLLKADGILIVQMPSFKEDKPYLDMVKQNDSFV
jgi:2-polyprenyl-3-methyl-5-hydroxy-6-metoxy-1,4-benzoquinol methylase